LLIVIVVLTHCQNPTYLLWLYRCPSGRASYKLADWQNAA